ELNMIELAKRTGSDIPPSLYEKSCMVAGVGEKLDFHVKIPKLNILLVNPLVPVSTAEVFRKGFANLKQKLNSVQYVFENQEELIEFLKTKTENSLYKNALKICPEIVVVEKIVSAQEGCLFSRMSGSGGTV